MVNQVSALQEHYNMGHFGTATEFGVTLQEVTHFNLVQIAAWPEALSAVGAIVAQAVGVESAPKPCKLAQGAGGLLLRTEPLKWQVFTKGQNFVSPEIAVDQGAVLDLSHSRTMVHVSGDKAETLLNLFLPLDLRETAFGVDDVASTAMHHLGVTLWRVEAGGFMLSLPRSFAVSLWELLSESALQFGLTVK